MANAKVQVRRVYEDLAQSDGTRVPVHRIEQPPGDQGQGGP